VRILPAVCSNTATRIDLAACHPRYFAAVLGKLLVGAIFLIPSFCLEAQETPNPDNSSDNLQPVIVIGRDPITTQTRAIEDQRLAPNIENVQSAEQIAKYPDVNMADALKRLPGVGVQNDTGEGRYITIRGLDSDLVGTTFGGVRVPSNDPAGRHVAFDEIPSGLVSQIIVTKANRSDMDAEALGGTIELVPRSAFDLNRPSLEGHLGSGNEPLRSEYGILDAEVIGGTTFGFGPGGNPFAQTPALATTPGATGQDGADAKSLGSGDGLVTPYRPFGVLGQFSFYEDHRGVDDFEPAYSDSIPPIGSDKILAAIDFRRYTYNRTLHGYGATFDYRPDSNNSFYISFVNAGYTEQARKEILTLNGLDGSGQNGKTSGTLTANPNGSFTATDVQMIEDLSFSIDHTENWIVQGGGRDQLGPVIIDYKGSFAQAYDSSPNGLDALFQTHPNETVTYDNSGLSNAPNFQYSNPYPVPNANPFNPTKYRFNSFNYDTSSTLDTELAGSANLTIPIDMYGNPSALKFGASVRYRTKTSTDNPVTYVDYVDPATGKNDFTLSEVNVDTFNTIYNGHFPIGYSADPGRITSFTSSHPGFIRDLAGDQLTSVQAFFDDSENVFAGYGQYDITLFGRLTILAGLRAEVTNAVYGAYANPAGTDPNLASSYVFVNRQSNYTDIFPTAQARIEIVPGVLQARLAYSTAIGRPSFAEITAATTIDHVNQTITTGNPNLKPTTANNFDFTLEYNPTKDSFFTLDLFDKEFDNYIFTRTIREVIGGVIFQDSTFLNSGTAYARGIEFAFEEHMRFLPGPLGGLGFAGNYTYVDSEGRTRPTDHTKLPFTSPNLYNIAFFYEKYGFTISLSGQYTDHNLSSVGTTYRLDQYFDNRFTLDFSATYMTRYGVGVYFNAKNLTNAPWRVYEGAADRPIQREYYGITYEAGMKFKF
jgi:TonB-dependent receptor